MTHDPVPDRPDPDLSPLVPPRSRNTGRRSAVEFLMAESGATRRQIDYWRRAGYIGDHLPVAPGTGRPVRWRAIDLAVLTALVALSDALDPHRPDLWRRVADAVRRSAARFDATATVDVADRVAVTLPVRTDWWRYARRYDDTDAQPFAPTGERHPA